MSVACMTWVFTHSTAAGADRLLLLAIADHAGDDGSDAWPAVPTLARKTGISERSVQRGIARLVAGGHLEVERGAGRGGTNRYRVLMAAPGGDSLTPPAPRSVPATPRQPVTRGDKATPVTQLRHQGGDTQASPERPRTSSSPQPPETGGDRPTPSSSSASRKRRPSRTEGTNPRALAAAEQRADTGRELAAAADHRRARQQAIAACNRCSKAGYLPGGKVCDHDPETPERAARGLELVRAELAKAEQRKRPAS